MHSLARSHGSLPGRHGHGAVARARRSALAPVPAVVLALLLLTWASPLAPGDAPHRADAAADPWALLARMAEQAASAEAARLAWQRALPASALGAAVAVSALATPAEPPLAAGEVPVCGLGTVRLDDQHPTPLDHVDASRRELAWHRLHTAMAIDADARVRAAGLLWRVRRNLPAERLAELAETDAACRSAQARRLAQTAEHCAAEQARVQAEALAPAADAADQLARMAQLSDDPVVLAFAREACAPPGLSFLVPQGNCQRVDAAFWADRSPRAAAPWLLLAEAADERGDRPAADQALARATQAAEVDAAANAPAAMALAALDAPAAALSPLERTLVQAEIGTVSEAGAALGAADRLCAPDRIDRAQRHGLCDALARLLVERARTEAALTLGLQLGERLGWPAERTAAAVSAQRAAADARLDHLADAGQGLSCGALQRQRQLVMRAAEVGEVAATRQLLVAPPR